MKILITTLFYNQVESSKRFLNSVFKNTDRDIYDLAILNNGSTDETYNYCEQLKQEYSNVYIYHNVENIGFPKGHNFLLKEMDYSKYDYVVLANNDIEVYENWLNILIEGCRHSNSYMVAPVNRVRGQLIVGGKLLNKEAKGEYVYLEEEKKRIDWLQFSCVLIKSEVFGMIGFLEEAFGLGYYEDVDYCLRMKQANLPFSTLTNLIIEHYDGVTSKQILSKNKIMEKSRQYFCNKWKEYLKQL